MLPQLMKQHHVHHARLNLDHSVPCAHAQLTTCFILSSSIFFVVFVFAFFPPVNFNNCQEDKKYNHTLITSNNCTVYKTWLHNGYIFFLFVSKESWSSIPSYLRRWFCLGCSNCRFSWNRTKIIKSTFSLIFKNRIELKRLNL